MYIKIPRIIISDDFYKLFRSFASISTIYFVFLHLNNI